MLIVGERCHKRMPWYSIAVHPLNTTIAVGGYGAPEGTRTHLETIELTQPAAADPGNNASNPTGINTTTRAAADSASYLVQHPFMEVVYAVEEFSGLLRAWRTAADGVALQHWEALGEPTQTGDAACHIAVHPNGSLLIVSCWGSGEVFVCDLNDDGSVRNARAAAASIDTYRPAGERQSRAHLARFLDNNLVVTTDLGHDALRLWRNHRDEATGLTTLTECATLPVGNDSGPRHLCQAADGTLFVVTEYSLEVIAVAVTTDAAGPTLRELGRTAARPQVATTADPSATPGADAAAEICLDERHSLAYVGIRGANTITAVRVGFGAEQLQAVAEVPCGGDWPRHHVLLSGTDARRAAECAGLPEPGAHESVLLVANQLSETLSLIPLDPTTGMPGSARTLCPAASPTVLLPLRPL